MYRYFYSSRLWLRLNAEQCAQLEDALPHVGSRLRPRLQAILMLDGGLSATEIAKTLGVHRNTVYNWIKRFDQDGLDGLWDRSRSGRPPKVDAQYRASLQALIQGEGITWTAEALQAAMHERTGVEISSAYLRQLLHGMGFVVGWTQAAA